MKKPNNLIIMRKNKLFYLNGRKNVFFQFLEQGAIFNILITFITIYGLFIQSVFKITIRASQVRNKLAIVNKSEMEAENSTHPTH